MSWSGNPRVAETRHRKHLSVHGLEVPRQDQQGLSRGCYHQHPPTKKQMRKEGQGMNSNKCHEEFTTYLTTTLPFKSPIPSIFSNWSLRLSDSSTWSHPFWAQEIHLLFSNGARKDGTVGPVSGTPNNVAIRLELAEELKDAPPFWGEVWAWCEEWASHFWLRFFQRGWNHQLGYIKITCIFKTV